MDRIAARGKYLWDGADKFMIRGVSYGPFTPNSRGERYPEPERAAADFALMRELGANLARLYVPPPLWLVEAAERAGIRLMVGIPWPFHMAILDSPDLMRETRAAIRKTVAELRAAGPTILAFSLGNEVRSDIVRWHGPRAISRYIAELCDLGKQADPDASFTYSNYPSTEYLDLSFLDFISFNVYLHDETDYRRYLTHLMAITGDLPVVLSETGMDTIREGEAHQAELLAWQSRAAFKIGLSGFIVFAFTDEWHTGGCEISDWAFGLTRRDRSPKPAFNAVGEVFRGALPPRLNSSPKASAIVCAYNAATTLGECLESLKQVDYPDFEIIVVDDGSTDPTAAIAECAGVRTIKTAHRGLGAARNAGIAASSGEIVAFLDADARADRDWLYHLVEAIVRHGAAGAGGPNFAPPIESGSAAAMAAAPGLPREVRADGGGLSQLCGCNMAIARAALDRAGGFDPIFTAAGDDVDLSWRLAAVDGVLVHAPGAVVIHERRATLGAYLRQQWGYGAGEGLLYRKYPNRAAAGGGIYGGAPGLAAILGGARVYYGEFGRGLFQSAYSAGPSILEIPLSIYWIKLSVLFAILGLVSGSLGALGWIGIASSLLAAAAGAIAAPLPPVQSGAAARLRLWILNLLGPSVRSFARERIKWSFAPGRTKLSLEDLKFSGRIEFGPAAGGVPIESAKLLAALHDALVRRGMAAAATDGFQSYDLEIIVPPLVRIPINALRRKDGAIELVWRTRIATRRMLAVAGFAAIAAFVAGASILGAVAAAACVAIAAGAAALNRIRRIPAPIAAAAREAGMAVK